MGTEGKQPRGNQTELKRKKSDQSLGMLYMPRDPVNEYL